MQNNVITLVLAWYVTHTMASYYAKSAFYLAEEEGKAEEMSEGGLLSFSLLPLSLAVSFLQLAMSGVVGKMYLIFRGVDGKVDPWKYFHDARVSNSSLSGNLLVVAACNAAGTVLTNIAYLHANVSLVQLIKSMEFVATYICEGVVFKTVNNWTTVLGGVLVVLGSLVASSNDLSMNTSSMAAILLANVVLPIRNVLTKSAIGSKDSLPDGSKSEEVPKGFLLFALISSIGAVFVGIATLLSMAMFSFVYTSASVQEALRSSFMYTTYNSISFVMLGVLDPGMHAILNVLKRAFTVITSMAIFSQPFTSEFIFGLFVVMGGLVVYLVGKKTIDPSNCFALHRKNFLFGAFISAVILLYCVDILAYPLLQYDPNTEEPPEVCDIERLSTFVDEFSGGGMNCPEQDLLAKWYSTAGSVFEWGMGSSTLVASYLGVSRLTAVDSAQTWVENVRTIASHPTYTFRHANVGPIVMWGYPADDQHKDWWPEYSLQVDRESSPFDIYLVDGRFRVASACRALLHGHAESYVLVHDFDRYQYQVLLTLADRVEQERKLIVLKRKSTTTDEELLHLWDEYKFVQI